MKSGVLKIAGGVTALAAAAGIVWGVFADHPARPALKYELDALAVEVATNTRESLWVQLKQLERIKARRPLSARECARYIKIAKTLGVPASC